MFKDKQVNSDVIVFSQWSRKGYAVFASLKKVVCIACLSIDICQSSLLKLPAVLRMLALLGADDSEHDESDMNEYQENSPLLLELMPIISSGSDIYSKEKLIRNKLRKPIFC